MLFWKIHVPDALFTPPVPDKSVFSHLIEALGVYQGIFRNNGYLELYSRYQTRIWPNASHDKTYQDLILFLNSVVLQSERPRYLEFQEKALMCPETLFASFDFSHPGGSEFSHIGILLRRSPWGMHVVFVPGRTKKEIETTFSAYGRVCWEALWDGLSSWFMEEELERLTGEALRMVPDEIADGIVLYRSTLMGPPDKKVLQHLVYDQKKGKWDRRVLEEEIIPHSLKVQAYRDKHELFLRTSMFLGGVFPVLRVDIQYRSLEAFGLQHFQEFLERYSCHSITLARSDFSTPSFRFSRYWSGMGYSMDGLLPIASILLPEDPGSLVALPIWGVSESSVEQIKKVVRLSDPLFFDWEKGMGLVLLRDCSMENAEKVVLPNLLKKLSFPLDFPITVNAFMESR
ncbi:MAG: hypothetical protein ACYCYP_11865 [Leptospirales bacterium]